MTDPIDLDAHRPHDVSKMLCTICWHKWTAVHPVGTTGLECPNCHEMKGRKMTEFCEWTHDGVGPFGYEWNPASCGFQTSQQLLKQELPYRCPSCGKLIKLKEAANEQ